MAIARRVPGIFRAFLCYGFRALFGLGAIYVGVSLLFCLALLYGHLATSSVFAPVDWHVHELLFGYLAAVLTGFLLTAIPNWTGRLPVQGLPLFALVLLWLAGRVAVFYSAQTGWLVAALIDCAFLLAVAGAAAVEIVAGRNWRNLKVLIPVVVLLAANVLFHVEAHIEGLSDIARRLAIGAAIVLVLVIGGRLIPSFTRNWLAREVRSAGSRSGVNWTRAKSASRRAAKARIALVLARPGAPSTSRWPSASRAINKRSMSADWPTISADKPSRKVRKASWRRGMSSLRLSIDGPGW